jgi:hypothetical protein
LIREQRHSNREAHKSIIIKKIDELDDKEFQDE